MRASPYSILASNRVLRLAPHPLLTARDIPAPHIGTIRILTLNSPPNRNAISHALLTSLTTHINTLSTSGDGSHGGVRALIIASALENVFCAGADLKERRGMSDTETAQFLRRLRDTFTALAELPIPSISAVAATALGGGFELALATTFRVCAAGCTLGLPETRLGIVPGAGGTYRLGRLVGETRALEMVLSGRRINGYEAGRMGVCERVVAEAVEGGVLDAAVRLAREICEGGPVAVGAAMRAVKGGRGVGGERGRERDAEVEEEEYVACLRRGRGDRDEALRAFGEKRAVEFRGEGGWDA